MLTLNKIILTTILLISAVGLNAQRLENRIDLRGMWKFRIGDRLEWAAPGFDDSRWESIRVPNQWEDEGFNGYDGYAWYRTTFDGSRLREEKDVYLNLGYIDDADEVYLNGQLIGASGQFPPHFQTAYEARRIYYIPIEHINVHGENIIAVRVYDTVHGGGIISGRIGLYVPQELMSSAMILEGMWKFKFGDLKEWRDPEFDDSDWDIRMVPSFWNAKRFNIKDFYSAKWGDYNYGWYRKEFKLPGKFQGEEMSIVLGKIDDFDQVYLNGRFIGETNDGRRFGRSMSFQETRVYDLPAEYLNENGWNVISVRVTDMGGDAGIYAGPVGIVRRENVDEFLDWGWFEKR